jgi:hypothetical protein
LFLRLWEQRALTPTLARHVLNLSWSERDEARMSELAVKNREGELTPAEQGELDTYVRVGLTLSVLQSRARKRLAKPSAAGTGRG